MAKPTRFNNAPPTVEVGKTNVVEADDAYREKLTPRPRITSVKTEPKWECDESVGGTGLLKVVGGLTFDSSFDSANLKDCYYNTVNEEYELYIAKDCDGTPHQTR
jgi:hypothetical protein